MLNLRTSTSNFSNNHGHPSHTKQSIPYGMALRLRRICSTEPKPFYRTFRQKRIRPPLFSRTNKQRKEILTSTALEKTTKSREENKILFVVTFNPTLPNISEVISFERPHWSLAPSARIKSQNGHDFFWIRACRLTVFTCKESWRLLFCYLLQFSL